jgi:hypothetical protein
MRPRAASRLSALAAVGVVAAGIAAVAVAGGPGGDSGVRGRVVPCGLIHERAAPCAAADAGAGTRVVARRATNGAVVGSAKADAHGRFRLELEPGRYVVEARMDARRRHGGGPLRVSAVVPQGEWVAVTLLAGRPVAATALGR